MLDMEGLLLLEVGPRLEKTWSTGGPPRGGPRLGNGPWRRGPGAIITKGPSGVPLASPVGTGGGVDTVAKEEAEASRSTRSPLCGTKGSCTVADMEVRFASAYLEPASPLHARPSVSVACPIMPQSSRMLSRSTNSPDATRALELLPSPRPHRWR
ncbi:hypothetical protein E2562_012441 [Oryza meyeriana var. granulata]|uniref:Uncharacterized protein n=1 Tax=Oryza meyeriana var. granulata TaxID=110450 RepID=A0A6G1C784_9ORYZ|nr:hypothetical protein E2562_012441 [Oryza meyeriana var. granulata]